MAKIGAWNRNQPGSDENWLVDWTNESSGAYLKAFKHPNGDWNVSVLRPGHLYENLLGGKNFKENQSKTNALKVARQYMRDNP